MKASGTEMKGSVTFQTQAFDLSAQVSQLKAEPTDLVGVGSGPEAGDPAGAGDAPAGPQRPAGRRLDHRRFRACRAHGRGRQRHRHPDHVLSAASATRPRRSRPSSIKRAKAAGIERSGASQFDAATYDIVLFYAHAMKQAKVTGDPAKLAAERTAIRDALRAMKPYPALEGPISFGKNGDALKPVYIIEMQDGKWNLIGTHPAGS